MIPHLEEGLVSTDFRPEFEEATTYLNLSFSGKKRQNNYQIMEEMNNILSKEYKFDTKTDLLIKEMWKEAKATEVFKIIAQLNQNDTYMKEQAVVKNMTEEELKETFKFEQKLLKFK